MKICNTIYFILSALIFGACQSDVPEPKIGLLMDSFVHERWQKDKETLTEELENRGADVIFKAAEGDAQKQLNQARELLAQGVKVLIVVPVDQVAASAIVLAAHEHSVKVIAYDRLIKRCNLDYYISFDHVNVGRIQAKAVIDNIPKPVVCVIGGSIHDNNAYMIHAGQNSVLEPMVKAGNATIASSTFTEKWLETEGYKEAYTALQNNPAINSILAANDALAAGAIRAIDSLGNKPIYITGMDADSAALHRITSKTQSMTVYKPVDQLAATAADLAYKICASDSTSIAKMKFVPVHNGQRAVESLLLESVAIDQKNISQIQEN